MPIRMTGINSGMDTESIIKDLVKVKSAKKENKSEISNLLSKGACLAVAQPITVVAGVGYLTGKFLEGVFTKKTVDQAMTEGCQTVGKGIDMLVDMWNGNFF